MLCRFKNKRSLDKKARRKQDRVHNRLEEYLADSRKKAAGARDQYGTKPHLDHRKDQVPSTGGPHSLFALRDQFMVHRVIIGGR